MTFTIDITRHSGDWFESVNSLIESTIVNVLEQHDIDEAEISVVLGNNIFVQELNRDYRDKDEPTNVLSFPQEAPMLGDIIFAHETIIREADEQKKSFNDHLSHLVVHGTLHLLGYDHIKDEEAEEMEALEIEILKKIGIENPYRIS